MLTSTGWYMKRHWGILPGQWMALIREQCDEPSLNNAQTYGINFPWKHTWFQQLNTKAIFREENTQQGFDGVHLKTVWGLPWAPHGVTPRNTWRAGSPAVGNTKPPSRSQAVRNIHSNIHTALGGRNGFDLKDNGRSRITHFLTLSLFARLAAYKEQQSVSVCMCMRVLMKRS